MALKKLIFLIFVFYTSLSYSMINPSQTEDSFIQIKCNELKDDFFMVKYDFNNDKVYIGLNSLFYFLELYDFSVDTQKKSVSVKINNNTVQATFNDDEAFVSEEDLYVSSEVLKTKLNFNSVNFDFSLLSLSLTPNFILPYEEREQGKIERLRLDETRNQENNKIDIEAPRKFLSPGLLKLDWRKYNTRESEYDFSYEYASEFLYGELYLYGNISPDTDIDYGNLTYSDIWQDNDLVIGNFSMITPSFVNVSRDIIGINFNDEDTYMKREGGIVIIKGEALDADIIEVYRNFSLIDYIKPQSKNFEFRISDGILNSDYTLKIYYKDGRIEERKVYSLNDMDILKKGKTRFTVQTGKTSSNGNPQGIVETYYGLTDNITIGAGIFDLVSDNDRKYHIIENSILFNTGSYNFPSLVNYKNYYEAKQKENSYNLSVNQKIYSYDLKFTDEKYSKYIYEDSMIKRYSSLSLGKNFESNSFEVGVDKKTYIDMGEDEKEEIYKNFYFSWYTSLLRPIFFSLRTEKNISKDLEYINIYPSVSYSGSFNIILDAELGKNNVEEKFSQSYSLRIDKRQIELVENKLYADLGIEARYSGISEKFRYGLTFSIELDDLFYLSNSTSIDVNEDKKRDTVNSIEFSKVIDLSNPKRKIKNNIPIDSPWIYGKIFLDKNSNGIFDNDDIPLSNAGITIDNKTFTADKNGDYVAEGITPNEAVTFNLDRKTIDPMYKNSIGPLKVKIRKSSNLKIDVPVEVVSMISGNIWNNPEFTEKEFIRRVSLTTIVLRKDGEIFAETDPEFDGMYFFEDVPSGEYQIDFIYLGGENITFTPNNLTISVKPPSLEEGEYYEGYDTEIIKTENVDETVSTNEDENDEFINEIMKNY